MFIQTTMPAKASIFAAKKEEAPSLNAQNADKTERSGAIFLQRRIDMHDALQIMKHAGAELTASMSSSSRKQPFFARYLQTFMNETGDKKALTLKPIAILEQLVRQHPTRNRPTLSPVVYRGSKNTEGNVMANVAAPPYLHLTNALHQVISERLKARAIPHTFLPETTESIATTHAKYKHQ